MNSCCCFFVSKSGNFLTMMLKINTVFDLADNEKREMFNWNFRWRQGIVSEHLPHTKIVKI